MERGCRLLGSGEQALKGLHELRVSGDQGDRANEAISQGGIPAVATNNSLFPERCSSAIGYTFSLLSLFVTKSITKLDLAIPGDGVEAGYDPDEATYRCLEFLQGDRSIQLDDALGDSWVGWDDVQRALHGWESLIPLVRDSFKGKKRTRLGPFQILTGLNS
jgi:hypothetical protein